MPGGWSCVVRWLLTGDQLSFRRSRDGACRVSHRDSCSPVVRADGSAGFCGALLLEAVLDLLAGVFEVGLALVALTFRLPALVAGGPAGQFLDLTREPLELVVGLVEEAHDLSFLGAAGVCFSCGGPQGLWSAAVAGVRAKSPVLDGADVGTSQGHSPAVTDSILAPATGRRAVDQGSVRCDPTRDGHLVCEPGPGSSTGGSRPPADPERPSPCRGRPPGR